MADRQKPVAPLQGYTGPGAGQYVPAQPLDRPDLRLAAQRAFGLGDVFLRVGDRMQVEMTKQAVQHAELEGAKASESRDITVLRNGKTEVVSVPKFTRAEGPGAMAEAWNRSALQTFALRLDTMTMQELARIEVENIGDPDAMTREIAAFSAGVKQELPAEYIERYDHDLMRLAQPMILGATQARIQKTAQDQALAVQDYQKSVIGLLVNNASKEGAAGIAGTTVNADLMQGLWDALAARVDGVTYSATDAVHDYQDTIRQAVPGIIQAQYATAPDKRAWMQAFLEGQVGIVVPHIDYETGRVTPGVHDEQALTELIDPDHLGQIINGMQADIRAQDAERRAAAAEAKAAAREQQALAQAEIYAVFDDAVAEAEATGRSPLSATEIMAAYPGRAGEKMVAKLHLAAETGSVRQTIAGNGPEEDAAYIESLKPVPGTPDFAEQTALHNIAISEYERKIKELETDPATYVMRTNAAVREAWTAAESDPEATKRAVAITKQAQAALGVPPERVQVMPAGQASRLASTLATATPDDVAATVDGIALAYGGDGLNQVIGAGTPPMVKVIAFANAPEQAAWRADAAQAMQIKESDLKAQAEARGVTGTEIDDAIQAVLPPLEALGPPSSTTAYLDAIRQVALYGTAYRGMDAKAAATYAFSAFDMAFQFQDTYRVPRRYDGDAVATGAAEFIGRLELLDIKPGIIGAPDPEFAKSETIKSLKDGNYRWVTAQGDEALILTYEEHNPVLMRDSKDEEWRPVRVTFEELMTLGTGKPSPGSMIEQLRGTTGAN